MAASENSAQRYFRLLRTARQQGSTTDGILKLVTMATNAVESSDAQTALTLLAGIHETVDLARPLLDGSEEHHEEHMELLMLRKQVLELRQENATLRGDTEAAAEYGRLIASMDELFSASIADLDPEP